MRPRHQNVGRAMVRWAGWAILAGMLLSAIAATPQSQAPPQSTKPPQTLPDAPKPQAPGVSSTFPAGTAPATKPQPGSTPAAPSTEGPTTPPPRPPDVITVPPGQEAQVPENGQEQMYKLTKNVNFVVVPVAVKDASGRLVEGLLPDDFRVMENGEPQQLKFFSSSPFALSAAVVIDVGMPDTALQKVTKTLSALTGAFSQFDELAVYTYGNTVKKVSDFTAVNDALMAKLRQVKEKQHGAMGGPPVIGGPMGQSGPTVNGRPLDPSQPSIPVPTMRPEQSHVLNDAVLAAARDLGRRDRARRRIIFIISDGREIGSNASYTEVLKVLLSEQIQVYGIGVDAAAIPIYRQLEKVTIPGRGTGDILPKYASATGGQVFDEFSQKAIETAYARVTEEARNQYTLGYTTRASLSNEYRSIEVTVLHHGADLKIYAKDGYYPLPPAR